MHKLAVKLDGIERRKRTTGLLHIAAGFFLLLQSIDYIGVKQYQNLSSAWPFFAAAILSLLYGVLKKKWDPQSKYNAWIRLLQVCVFTILAIDLIPYSKTVSVLLLFVWAIGCLLLMFTERKVFHDAEMLINRDGIFIPGYFTNRRLFWSNISEIVIRPDYVTIFQSNESFLQYEVLKKLETTALEELALYCKEQLSRKGTKTGQP
jgi:hypothetical protein